MAVLDWKLTYEWLRKYYGSRGLTQVEDTKRWLLRYGTDVPEEKLDEWSQWKHLSEYQVNTVDIVPKALDMINQFFISELHAHMCINLMRVPNGQAYLNALKEIEPSPKTILELGVGGDSAISTSIFLYFLSSQKEDVSMLSIDRNPLGVTWERYQHTPFWRFRQADSVEVLQEAVNDKVRFDMVFIDTIHSYTHTWKEMGLASQITDFMLLDDADFPGNGFDPEPGGVNQARIDFLRNNPEWKEKLFNGTAISLVYKEKEKEKIKKPNPKLKNAPKKTKPKLKDSPKKSNPKLKKEKKTMSKIAIGLAHGHAPKWLQSCLYSLQLMKNEVDVDVFVASTWPDHPSLRVITETDLGKGVTVIPCTLRLHSHATGLDQILDHIADKDYDYLFGMETDCVAVKHGWLDWFLSFMTDESIGMAGFFWHEGNNHYNINPSGTLYRKDMLLKYHQEVRDNMENMFWHPNGNKHGNDGGMDPSIKEVAGAFSETRGIKDPSDAQKDVILKGVPQASWFEPGAWLYCRSIGEYGGVSVPCDHIYTAFGRHQAPEGTYYGGKNDPQYIHYWGGTRTYDFLKHIVNDHFVSECAPLWIQREHAIWDGFVPDEYKAIMPSIYEEMEFEKKARENLPGWEKIPELMGTNWGRGV